MTKSNKKYYCIGVSVIDLTTGQNSIYEVYDRKDDTNFAFDETIRKILSDTPNEILINTKDLTISKQKLISRLHLYTKKVLHIKM